MPTAHQITQTEYPKPTPNNCAPLRHMSKPCPTPIADQIARAGVEASRHWTSQRKTGYQGRALTCGTKVRGAKLPPAGLLPARQLLPCTCNVPLWQRPLTVTRLVVRRVQNAHGWRPRSAASRSVGGGRGCLDGGSARSASCSGRGGCGCGRACLLAVEHPWGDAFTFACRCIGVGRRGDGSLVRG